MTETSTDVTLRLSTVTASCPRKAVYEATDVPARERTDREERILFRGRRLGRDYADWLAAKYGEENIERERRVTWPLGTGHADVYLPQSRSIIEILSSAHASEQMRHGKLLQLVGYIEHDPDADNGALIVLNPTDYSEDRTVLSPKSQGYAALAEEMYDRVAQVLAWRAYSTLPARVCGKPSEAISHFCMHASHCFDDSPPWEPPPLEQVAASDELIRAVSTFAEAKASQTAVEREARGYDEVKKNAQRIIEQAELPAGVELQVGPYKLVRTQVTRKSTFEWEKAELAGAFEPGLLGEFFKPGASYSTFKAERIEPADDDYGPVPF